MCVKDQVSMRCVKMGVKVKYDSHEAQHGDVYCCPVCGFKVVVSFGMKFGDPEPNSFDYERKNYREK